MKPSFIGLSTGRAGSRYFTKLLNDAGVKTTHETGIWDVQSLSKFMDTDSDVKGEVSAHYVTQIKNPVDFRIWHFTRHPQPFVSSMLKFGFWRLDTPNIHPFLRKTGDPLSDSYRYWVDWNQRILDLIKQPRQRATFFRIEDVNRDVIANLARSIGIEADTSKINPCWDEKQEFAEIPSEVEAEVYKMMEVLGYA